MTATDVVEPVVYLDHAGACPVLPEVLALHAARCQRYVANPHATSRYSEEAKRAVLVAERDLLDCLGIPDGQAGVVWTAGGTEANNLATLGVLRQHGGSVALIDAGAHAALAEPCRHHARREGGRCIDIPLAPDGSLDLEPVDPGAAAGAALVAVTHVNNETGAIADLPRLRAWMRSRTPHALLAVDAAQSFGRVALPWAAAAIDLLTVSARKIGGPAAVAGLVLRKGTRLEPVLHGGGQQGGLRSGTLDVVGIVRGRPTRHGFCLRQSGGRAARVATLGDPEAGPVGLVGATGADSSRPWGSPWILTFAVPGYEGPSSCGSWRNDASSWGRAAPAAPRPGRRVTCCARWNVPERVARCVLRVSFGPESTLEHVALLLRELPRVIARY